MYISLYRTLLCCIDIQQWYWTRTQINNKNLEIPIQLYHRLFILYEIRIFNEATSMKCSGRYVRHLVHWTVCHCHTHTHQNRTTHHTIHINIYEMNFTCTSNNSTIVYVWFDVITTFPCLMPVVWHCPKWEILIDMHTLTIYFQCDWMTIKVGWHFNHFWSMEKGVREKAWKLNTR